MAEKANCTLGKLCENVPMKLRVLGSVSEIPDAKGSQNGDLEGPIGLQ